MKHVSLLIVCSVFFSFGLSAQEADRPLAAARISEPPVIDGVLHDGCWENEGEWSATFVQQQPDEGKPETEETRLKILYDNHNIYVAFRALDAGADKINRWLAPRDKIAGDAVCIIFDSYADKRTGFAFALTAGGTKADFLCSNTDEDDYTWNAVWEGKTSYDGKGWYAEYRIP
ncbi:MAG: carbohydrate binding family 9 domain-containing protein, partial [Tannerellaceae bacterium]|nr:carbohydrate binding family 9 domain-containing protein [Tannerellaceae bacterium]